MGESKSQSTPSTPLNVHNCNIHAVNSRYSNTPSFKDRRQSLRYSTSILKRSGSVDTMSPISSELSSEAQKEYCDTVQEATTLECPEDDKKEEGEIDEIEDMDEDLLYLRLMALRSIDLRSEGPKENKFIVNDKTSKNNGTHKEIQCIDVEDMVDEMEDLLNEADQAAKLSPNNDIIEDDDGIEIIDREPPVIPVIDIPDSDEEQIDLELERWTKNKSISIATLDTTASFQQVTANNHTDMVKNELNGKCQETKYDNKRDYSKLVQRLRQTLERQQQRQNLIKDSELNRSDEQYSPTQSPIKELVPNGYHPTLSSKYDDHLKYSPTQSPLSEVVDTPIGSGGTTPGDVSPPTIPLQLPLSLNKKAYSFETMNDDQLPPLPPGSPPWKKDAEHLTATGTSNNTKRISKVSPYKPMPPVSNWKSHIANEYRASTPPPPGEENSPLDYNYHKPLEENLNKSVDMELGSDNEAEIQFFKDQQDQVKNYGDAYRPSNSTSNRNDYNIFNQDRIFHNEFEFQPKMSDVLQFDNPQDRYNAFLHAVINRNSTNSNRDSRNDKLRKTKKRKLISTSMDDKVEKYAFGSENNKAKHNIQTSPKIKIPEGSEYKNINQPDNNSDDDDPDQLRALLLSDLQKKKDVARKSQNDVLSKQSINENFKQSKETECVSSPVKILVTNSKSKTAENDLALNAIPSNRLDNSRFNVLPSCTRMLANEKLNEPSTINANIVANCSQNSKTEELKAKVVSAHPSEVVAKKIEQYRGHSSLNVSYHAALSELSKLSESTQRIIEDIGAEAIIRNFPNLVKPFIIPLNGVKTQKELSQNSKSVQSNDLGLPDFASKLDDFMREIRTKGSLKASSKKKIKTTPPPKPIRKNIPSKNRNSSEMKLKNSLAKNISSKALNSSISPAAKNHLMTASVSSLPRKKQEEYKRLKELIARKEKSKKQLHNLTTTTPTVDVYELVDNQENIDISNATSRAMEKDIGKEDTHCRDNKYAEDISEMDDEADQLRQVLLSNMNKHPSGISAVGISKTEEPTLPRIEATASNASFPSTIPSTAMKISVSYTGSRDVRVEESAVNLSNKKHISNPKKELLDLKEKKLGFIRKTVTKDLYKLSAQLSQLRNETNRKHTAEEYLQNLKQKITEVESLVARKNDRILQIKEVVMHSHNEISNKRKEMVNVENECKSIGNEVFGPFYKPPQESSRKIREKIALIKKHAKEIQPDENSTHYLSNEKGGETTNTDVQHKKYNNGLNELQYMKTCPENNGKSNEAITCPTLNNQPTSNESQKQIISGISSTGSALAHLRQSEHANKFDPHKEFCRYELQGKCNDDSCGYQHQYPKV